MNFPAPRCPCRTPAPQGLPQAVEDKRAEIFKMASSCDIQGLADIAVADGIAFS